MNNRTCPKCKQAHVIPDGYCGVCRECTLPVLSAQETAAVAGAAPCSVEIVGRRVIEKKLLDCLQDADQVAVLATRRDIEDMIFALEAYNWDGERKMRCRDMALGMRQLLREAFPPND